jgi:putative transposase
MARPARLQFEGAFYHVINRGNGRSVIFADDHDRRKFLEFLAAIQKKTGLIVYAFVLMSNHYHLLVETPRANLSKSVQMLNGQYAQYYSRRHKRPGHLFQGRFKALLVEKDGYLLELTRYIHLNPIRAKIINPDETYRWSSLSTYVSGKTSFPCKIEWEWILSLFGQNRNRATARYLSYIREGAGIKSEVSSSAKGGWLLGSELWVKKMLSLVGKNDSHELTGLKPLANRTSLEAMEAAVCSKFKTNLQNLYQAVYGNVGRQAATMLSVDYCGLSLKEASVRYKYSYSSVGQATSRFRKVATNDKNLKKTIDEVLKMANVKV